MTDINKDSHSWRKTLGGRAQSFCTAYFAGLGYIVSQPLNDDAPYDLIVDDGDKFQKVQCKSALSRKKHGYASAQLGQAWAAGKHSNYHPGDFDLLWVMTGQGFYLIPEAEIICDDDTVKRFLCLSPRWNRFIVEDFWPHADSSEEQTRKRAARLSDRERQRIISRYQDQETSPDDCRST